MPRAERDWSRFCRRGVLVAIATSVVAAGAFLAAPPSAADEYPTGPIRIIVPWNTGGPNDVLARALADKLGPSLRATIVIENRPGANGTTGTSAVAKSAPDGHTLLLTSSAHTLNVGMYKSLPYDPLKDFAPVTMIAQTRGSVLVVRRDFPADTIAQFVQHAKSRPNGVSVANNGVGNATHVASELLAAAAAIKLVPVPYRGTAPFVTDLIGGHVEAGVMATVAAIPLVRNNSLKALLIFGSERTPSLPDVPTVSEAGYPGIEVTSYYGIWAPANTPRERVHRLQQAVAAALDTPELKKLMDDSDLILRASKPDDFARYLAADVPKVLAIFKKIGIKPQ